VGGFVVIVLGFMVLRTLGIGPAGSLLASGRMTDKERLLVTDFRAPAADSSLGGVVTEAVRTDLGQSPVVSIVSASTVSAALSRMQRPPATRIDLPLARDIAAREGIKAVVDGDITSLAGGYVLTIRLVTAGTGDELASYHATIDGPKELIPAIDKLSRDLRGKIGESLKEVRDAPPLEQVTTTSLDALRKYAEAVRANDLEGDPRKAIPLLEDAVALDTTFAMAYRKLGIALANSGMPSERVDAAMAHAYRYRDRLAGRERDLAIASFFDQGPGRDRQKAAAAYRAMLARDSLDPVALIDLGNVQIGYRDFAGAATLARAVPAIDGRPAANASFELAIALIDEGKLAEAESVAVTLRNLFPGTRLSLMDASVLYAQGKTDSAMARLSQVRTSDRSPGKRATAVYALSTMAQIRGRLAESTRLAAEAWAIDRQNGSPPPPLVPESDSAAIDVWFLDQPARATRLLDAALMRTPLRTIADVERNDYQIATAYALAGHPDRARAILVQYATEVQDSSLQRVNQAGRHNALAEIALAERRPRDAIAEFRQGDQLPDGPATDCSECLSVNLGRAFDAANMPDSVIANYERYIAKPNFGKPFRDALYLAGVQKRLGELYEAKGNREKAAAHYLAFVDLWKNADPELQPAVTAVKQRLAHLQDAEQRQGVR
jgi:tetratricopeptide (TPR) repeat protein